MIATTGIEIANNTKRWPLRTVKYSQSGTVSPTEHRPDCSGFASMCIGLPQPGENTVTLVTELHVREIRWADLQVGDLVGKMGPGTEGSNGHVAIVTSVAMLYFTIREQSGPTGVAGPNVATIRFDKAPFNWKPYRSNYIIEGDDMPIYGRTKDNPTVYCSNGIEYRPVANMKNVIGNVHFRDTLSDLEDLLGKPWKPSTGSISEHIHSVGPAISQ